MCVQRRRDAFIPINRGAPPAEVVAARQARNREAMKLSRIIKFLLVLYNVFAVSTFIVTYGFIVGPCDVVESYIGLQQSQLFYSFLKLVFYSFYWVSLPCTILDVLFHACYHRLINLRRLPHSQSLAKLFQLINEVLLSFSAAIGGLAVCIKIMVVMPVTPCGYSVLKILLFIFTRALSFLLTSLYLELYSSD